MDTVQKSCHLCDAPWMDLSDFSPSQRQIVEAGDGPLGVLAGPGSGKTTVLAGRIAYLVEQRGVPPASIMAITFTTTAAATLRGRLTTVLGGAAGELTITTFHALGLRLIRQWSRELGLGISFPRSMDVMKPALCCESRQPNSDSRLPSKTAGARRTHGQCRSHA